MTAKRRGGDIKANRARADELAAEWRLDGGVGFLIRLMDARYHTLYQTMTRQDAITPRQFGVLIALQQHEAMTLTDLAATVRADRSTLGEMISRMAMRKLVAKKDNRADRRSFEISIAPAGRTALLGLVERAERLQGAFLAPLPERDREHFLECLRLVACAEETKIAPM